MRASATPQSSQLPKSRKGAGVLGTSRGGGGSLKTRGAQANESTPSGVALGADGLSKLLGGYFLLSQSSFMQIYLTLCNFRCTLQRDYHDKVSEHVHRLILITTLLLSWGDRLLLSPGSGQPPTCPPFL